jgi:glycosyltransferase involved in cell wall biosynthesis
MDWLPNIEGVHWFATEILPRIRREMPEVRFTIVGRNPAPSIWHLAQPEEGVEVTGTVPDVRPYLIEGDVMVVPLKSGGGTRIKILEAMAAGIPIISTTVGAEGLGLTPGKEIVIADDPADFAREALQLLSGPRIASELAKRARERVISLNDWSSVTNRFLELCGSVIDRNNQ